MDLNLSLGPPRPRGLDLGFDLALGSPAAPPPSSASASASSSSSSSTEEPRAAPSAAAGMAEPPPFPHPPYSPSCATFGDPTDHPPRPSTGGADPAPEYSPYSPSYQPLGPPYAPITAPPPPPSAAASFRRHGALYPASYVRVFPADGDSDGFLGDGGRVALHMPYDPLVPPSAPEEDALAGGGGAWRALPLVPPFSPPPYVPLSMIPEDEEDVALGRRPILFGSDDGSSSRSGGFRDAEVHIRRLFALRESPWDGGPFRVPSDPYGDEPPGSAATTMGPPGRLARETLSSEASAAAEIPGKNKANDEGVADKGPEEDKEERSASAVNFECNICLELAKEPVVTPCGHLFCWPCLYQWLHLHCNYNECPVCKGEVVESEITPIYGRGSPQTRVEEEEDADLGLKIPPRPRGRRLESWRQRIQRPISRRFGIEVANSWRRLFGEEVHFGSMIDVHGDPTLQQIFGVEGTSIAHGSSRVGGDNMESGFFSIGRPVPWRRNASPVPQNPGNRNSVPRGSFEEIWTQISSNGLDRSGGFTAAAAGPSRILGRTDSGATPAGTSGSLVNARIPSASVLRPPVASSRAAGQASASSTMAVIQGDVGAADAAVEPNSAGSSRNPRIRGRGSSSLYADGCPIHACKGRRLN